MTAAKVAPFSPLTSGPIEEIEISRLRPAPWNARKTFDQDSLAELAASIRTHGVQVPLLVRRTSAKLHVFEIVAGHRRVLAAQIAGKTVVPCLPRILNDGEAREIGLIDNLQREGLGSIEEAEAYGALMAMPGATIEAVAARLGKAPSYVGRRLKLLDAIEGVREALKAGVIDLGHALELARLSPGQQTRLLNWLDVGFDGKEPSDPRQQDDEQDLDGDDPDSAEDDKGVCKYCGCTKDDACRLEDGSCSWVNAEQTVCSNPDCVESFREAGGVVEGVPAKLPQWHPARFTVAQLRGQIGRWTLKVLSEAPFPLDAPLSPMACTDCPKRSGNAALLFDDCGQDTCTDRICFDAKVKVWIKAELDAADREKHKLLMLSDGYSPSGAIPDYSVVLVSEQVKPVHCEHQEEAIYVDGDKAGRHVIICREGKCKEHHSQSRYTGPASRPEKAKEDRSKVLAKLNSEKKYRVALLRALALAPVSAKLSDELNVQACVWAIKRGNSQYEKPLAEAFGWPAEIFGWTGEKTLTEKLKQLTVAERARVVLLAANVGELAVHEYSVNAKPEDFERLAKLLGVDAKKIHASTEAKPGPKAGKATPAVKKLAKKTAPKPAKKPAKKAVRK